MYGHNLVPTDGNDHAEQFGATVDSLFVVEPAGSSGHWDFEVEKQEASGQGALDAVAALGDDSGVRVDRHLHRGTPSR